MDTTPPKDQRPSDPTEPIEAPAAAAAGEIQSGRLAGKSLGAAIAIVAFPVLLQQVMAAFVGLVDKMLAGNLADDIVMAALDGVGVASYVGWLIGIAMSGLGIGGQAIIARAMGAGNVEEGEQALGHALGLSVAWGVLCGIVMWFTADALASIGQLGPEATTFSNQYIRTFAVSMPFFGVMMVGAMCMHGAGETLRPFLIAVAVNIVNVIVSWVLSGADLRVGDSVLVNPFSFDLDVLGIALGSGIGMAVGAVPRDQGPAPAHRHALPAAGDVLAGGPDRDPQLLRRHGDVDRQHHRAGLHRNARRPRRAGGVDCGDRRGFI